ncbi:MAG: lytic murein transglycosylase, partial [Thermoleophilaceae bacterium]
MADARDNAAAQRPLIEIDRFEHVLASPERALLRLDGRYSDAAGDRTLDAVLVVDDGNSVRRHLALPDPNRLDPELAEEEEWFWRTAFVVSTACLRDQRTAFAIEAEPGVRIELPFPVERLVPEEVARRAIGGRIAGRQAVALGLALTIALSSSALPALADTHVLNVHGPDGKVTQVPATGGAVTPAPSQAVTQAAAPAQPQPAAAAEDTTQQPSTPDVTTPTPTTDETAPVQQGDPNAGKGVKQEHTSSGHHQSAPSRPHEHGHRTTTTPRHHSAPQPVAPAPRRTRHGSNAPATSTPPVAHLPKLPKGSSFDQLPGPTTSSVPNLLIQRFHVPIFLLPIYQAAGIQYGIRWEILAAINEIETDYGRNLNVSSAGAVGWMQFMPATWKSWGVDANKDGKRDPFNPVDAIFSAARYLKAAGGDKNVRQGIFAYNHAGWYVDSVMLRARLLAGLPPDFTGSLTGLTEGRFPVAAKARYADAVTKKDALKKVKVGQNAANVVEGTDARTGIEIYAAKGAPVVAANDGVIKKIGVSRKIGRYIVLQDVYGNQYTYAGLGSVAKLYPVPKAESVDPKDDSTAVKANDGKDPKPTQAATDDATPTKPSRKARKQAKKAAKQAAKEQAQQQPVAPDSQDAVVRPRLFA